MKLEVDLVKLDRYEFVNLIKAVICFYQVQFGRDFEFEIVKKHAMLKIPSQLGRTDFIRSFTDEDNTRHVLNRGSGIIRSMVEANSYIIIDENDEGYQKGDIVDVVFFNSLLW